MANQRRRFTPEFKQEIIKLVMEQGKPVSQVAQDIEVDLDRIYFFHIQYSR